MKGPSGRAHRRYAHAKGIVCQVTFKASPGASALSRASHFNGEEYPLLCGFPTALQTVKWPDTSPDAALRGMAIRFGTGRGTDIMTISRNGFIVGTGGEFLALQKAIAATEPSGPHPSPIEEFLGSHHGASSTIGAA